MFPSFLPPDVENLTEPTSIALAQRIQRQGIPTPLREEAIVTSFVRDGSGDPPILLLHGFDSSLFEFRRLLPLLSPYFETWALDLLGFGFGDRPVGLPTPAAIKTHLHSFWQEAIARPVILVGVSMGGAAAIDFTLSYPDAVDRLVLVDSAGFAKAPVMSRFLFPPLGYWATEFLRNPRVRQKISEQAYYDRTFASVDAAICAALHLKMPGWSEATISFTKSGGYGFLRDKIGRIEKDTLILWGDRDRIIGVKDATRFEEEIAGSKLIWIPECGHVPHLEKPRETARHIVNFSGRAIEASDF